MIRIDDYEQLKTRIVNWVKDYYWKYNIKALVVGVKCKCAQQVYLGLGQR